MFTQKELNMIDRSYFNVLQASSYAVTLQSKNTKHYWHILHEEYPNFSSCSISHKHNYSDEYHPHKHQPTLKQALRAIRSHDSYQINVRDKQKRARHRYMQQAQDLAE